MMYLSNQKAVISRQQYRDCGHDDINRLPISDSLETTPHEAPNLEGVHVLQPHQSPGSPLEVLQFGQFRLFLLVTGPEGWTAEGHKVNCGGWGVKLSPETDVSVKRRGVYLVCSPRLRCCRRHSATLTAAA